jgi:TolB protein
MNTRRLLPALLAAFAAAGLSQTLVAADTPLVVPGVSSDPSARIPVSLDGFSGEALSALRFDLEVAGFEMVPADRAVLLISGSNAGSLVGRVTDHAKTSLLAKEYTGGSARLQAHTFADEIVELPLWQGRKGVARTKIAFKVDTGRNSEIYIADYDGYNAMPVTQDNTINRDPGWVPGRRALFYMSYRGGSTVILSQDLASGARHKVAAYGGTSGSPAASPDGRRVAMILSKGGSPDLYVANADGTGLRQLTSTSQAAESSPCWSPDGQTICFASGTRLYLINANGGSMRPLTTGLAGKQTEPSWSPDGKQIAFTGEGGGFDVCVVPAGGGSATRLVAGEDPSWAPNSRTLIFTSRRGSRRVLSLLDVPTKQVKDIRQISGSCSQPDWAR